MTYYLKYRPKKIEELDLEEIRSSLTKLVASKRIPHALLFAAMAIMLSIIPLIGPFIIWVPALIYLFIQGNTLSAVIFLIYNIVIVSNIDNILRIYILSKRTNLSTVIVLIGMIGGLFIFGILGLIIGPLLLAYFITFLHAYKDNTLSSLFNKEKEENA